MHLDIVDLCPFELEDPIGNSIYDFERVFAEIHKKATVLVFSQFQNKGYISVTLLLYTLDRLAGFVPKSYKLGELVRTDQKSGR